MCKNTYAKTRGEKPFDWNKALNQAIKKRPNYDQRYKLNNLALSWVTCACGNQCEIIPRGRGDFSSDGLFRFNGMPLDDNLSNLGRQFFQLIAGSKYIDAKKILEKIEKRSALLIAIELAKRELLFAGLRAGLLIDITVPIK